MRLELIFPIHLREGLKSVVKMPDLEEIRVRIGQPVFIYVGEKEFILGQNDKDKNSRVLCDSMNRKLYESAYRITEQDLLEMQNYISNYSLYAWQEELRNGFLTVEGGHRIGLCGSTKNINGRIAGISYLSGLNVRVAHEKKGCSEQVMKYIRYGEADIYNTLIVSAPGIGKTTLLRDCVRLLSYGEGQYRGKRVGVVDERSEIAACYHGIPQNDMGPRTDVLDGCNKPEGMMMLLRTMSPEVIGVDELGTKEDFEAVEQVAYCGCRLIGTVHAGNKKELQEKSRFYGWGKRGIFERFIIIEKGEEGKRNLHIYDNQWVELF